MLKSLTLGVLLVGLTLDASAHSWYPYECCSEKDCYRVSVDEVEQTQSGYVYQGRLYPNSIVKPSLDGDYHVCHLPNGMPLCFFVPLAS